MRRLPAILFIVAIPLLVLTAAEASATTAAQVTKEEMQSVAASLKGTYLFTQELYLPVTGWPPLARDEEPIPFVDVSHIDENLEIRTLSGVFHENGCGKVFGVGGDARFAVPFNASMGVGDFSAFRDWSIRAVYIHVLYDCGGTPIGYAWVQKVGAPLWFKDLYPPEDPGGPDEEGKNPSGGPAWDSEFVGWNGLTTIRFFDLKGNPLAIPVPGYDDGLTEISGPFRALRVTGEPHR